MIKKIIFIVLIISVLIPVLSFASDNTNSLIDELYDATFETLQSYELEDLGAYFMRGFAASKDGKYLYGGLVHENRGLFRFNAQKGYYDGVIYEDPSNGLIKGIATDNRGYVYAGITAGDLPDGSVSFACLDEELNELSYTTINIEGKVGINGVTVRKTGNKYLLYFITNYGPNTIRCYDVTNPKKPMVHKEFGINGIVDIKILLNSDVAEVNYMVIDSEGTVFLTANAHMNGAKGDSVYKISSDFKEVLESVQLNEAYGICEKGEYIFVSTYAGSESSIRVLNKDDLYEVAEIGNIPGATNYSGVVIIKDKIYVSDQGYDGGDRIIFSSSIQSFDSKLELDTKYIFILILFGVAFLIFILVLFSIKKLKKMNMG